MALIFFSGGESGTPDFTSTYGDVSCSTTHVKSGNYSLLVHSVNSTATINLPVELTDFYLTFWMWQYYGSGGQPYWYLQNNGNTVIYWRATSTTSSPHTFYVGSTAIGSTSSSIIGSTWVLMEMHIILHSITGLIHVRLNGVDSLIYSGNTVAAGYNTINRFYVYSSYSDIWIDDLIFNDTTGLINNSWMGGTKIVGLRPIGPGNSTQWIPSVGDNWQCVNEAPISETDYVSTDIAGALDLYNLESIPAGVCANSDFLGAKVFNGVLRSGLTTSYIKNVIRTNSEDTVSDTVSVPTLLFNQGTIWDLNPITGTTWSYTDINALEAGVKLV